MAEKSKSAAGKKGGLQILLPLFSDEMTMTTHHIGVKKNDHRVYYFNGMMPLFQHSEDDYLSACLPERYRSQSGNAQANGRL